MRECSFEQRDSDERLCCHGPCEVRTVRAKSAPAENNVLAQLLREHSRFIFENELAGWSTDESTWRKRRDYETFRDRSPDRLFQSIGALRRVRGLR